MKPRGVMAMTAFCATLCLAQPAQAKANASNQWNGTWRLDLARSHFSGRTPRAEIRSIAITDGMMTVRSVVTPGNGKRMLFYYSVSLDGRFHPLSGNPDGDSIAIRLVGPRKVDIIVRRAGATSARAVSRVAGDRLVMDRNRLQLSGSPSHDVMVYRRVR